MEKILVAGANGTTGTHIIDKLKYRGRYNPIAMIRKEEQQNKFDKKGVETMLGDLEGDLSGMLNGISMVVFAAGSGGDTGKDKTIAVDQEGAKKLIDEAKKANIKKFVMLSSMGADNPSSNESINHYLQAKQNADNYLLNSGLNYSIIRPGRLTNEDGKGNIMAATKLNEKGEISREDVAQVIVSALDHANTGNKTFEILAGNNSIEEALSKV